MGIAQRLNRSRLQREARAQGFEVAVGLPPRTERAVGLRDELTCPSCGRDGTIDLVDVPAALAHLSCPTCTTSWITDSERVRARR